MWIRETKSWSSGLYVFDDEGYPEIARCTEREFATTLADISAGGMYCPECGTVHWPDGVAPPF
ncbi:TPA: hypothetical protein ACNBO9_005360 [Escherichia coli]